MNNLKLAEQLSNLLDDIREFAQKIEDIISQLDEGESEDDQIDINPPPVMKLLDWLYSSSKGTASKENWKKQCKKLGIDTKAGNILARWAYVMTHPITGDFIITKKGEEKVQCLQRDFGANWARK